MRKALIIQGGYEGHNPTETAAILSGQLEENDFAVTIADSLDVLLEMSRLPEYDLIVPHWTMGIPPEGAVDNLISAVKSGCGLAGIHGGLGDAFRSETKFHHMTGGQFVAHPGDDRVTYTVDINSHEITEGMTPFSVTTELYYMHVDPANEVIATTETNGISMPISWVKRFGRGKIFYTSLGHSVEVVKQKEVLPFITKGMIWASR